MTTKKPVPKKPKPAPGPVKSDVELVPLDKYKRATNPPFQAREVNFPDEPEFKLPDPYAPKPVAKRNNPPTLFQRMADLADEANARADQAEANLKVARERIARLETRLARLGTGTGTAADEKPVRLAEGGGR